MKTLFPLFAILLMALAGCATSHPDTGPRTSSETVLIAYYPVPGKEAELEAMLANAWQVYQSENLVYAQPHVIVRDSEAGGKARYVEIFTWITSPDNPSAAVSTVWSQEQALCEARDGHEGIEIEPVEMIKGSDDK